MYYDSEKTGSGIRNVRQEEAIYPHGRSNDTTNKEVQIRLMSKASKTEQEKKSDLHYAGESTPGVKKTDMRTVSDGDPDENEEQTEELIEKTTWQSPQPDKDKDAPL